MEDSHITRTDIGPAKDTQLFGVFDGHGGTEVAVYVGNHFTEEFLKNPNFVKNDLKSKTYFLIYYFKLLLRKTI